MRPPSAVSHAQGASTAERLPAVALRAGQAPRRTVARPNARPSTATTSCRRRGRRCRSTITPAAAASTPPPPPPPPKKELWLQTTSPQAAAAAIEAGVTTLVFESAADAAAWAGLASFRAVVVGEGDSSGSPAPRPLTDAGTGEVLGAQHPIADATAAAALAEALVNAGPSSSASPSIFWAAAPPGAWSMIPTENLVAALGGRAGGGGPSPSSSSSSRPRLFVSAPTAAAALALLGALEAGADGAVLVTDDPAEARAAATAVAAAVAEAARPHVRLVPALVTAVQAAGMGDRVCVDLTSAMAPGEGLLVGSFARGLALVQAEVEAGEGYVSTRPFRVNAGALHSYVAAPGGKTAYLAELGAGSEVLVVDGATGATRTGTVGRAKVERRPLTRVTLAVVPPAGAEPAPGDAGLSCVLQNAETVRLVGPAAAPLPPAAAEAVRWAMAGGSGGGGGKGEARTPAPPPPPASRLRRSGSAALRWAMGDGAASSADEDEEEEGDERNDSTPPRKPVAAPPAAADALAWLMRDADGDGLPDDPDVDVSGMDEGLVAQARGGGGRGGGSGGEPRPPPVLGARPCTTTPVSALVPGTAVWVLRAPPARHTGIAVDEAIDER
jgi:3-dehydroquinate synthase class II